MKMLLKSKTVINEEDYYPDHLGGPVVITRIIIRGRDMMMEAEVRRTMGERGT